MQAGCSAAAALCFIICLRRSLSATAGIQWGQKKLGMQHHLLGVEQVVQLLAASSKLGKDGWGVEILAEGSHADIQCTCCSPLACLAACSRGQAQYTPGVSWCRYPQQA